MGGYVCGHTEGSPLLHDINRRENRIALTNCRIFDGVHPALKEEMTILVTGDKIVGVGHESQIGFPEDFFVVDVGGKTIMPGLIDSHVHLCSPFTYDVTMPAIRQMKKQVILNNLQTVYSGVTTVCDMGGPCGIIREVRELAERNDIPGPRSLNCYTLISPVRGKTLGYPPQVKRMDPFQAWLFEGQVATRPKTISELRKACYRVKADGGDYIKTTYQPEPFSHKTYTHPYDFPVFDDEWMLAILKIGAEEGLAVSIHCPFGAAADKCVDLAIKAGAEIRIQHMAFDRDLNDLTLRKMWDFGYYIIPTIQVYGDCFNMPRFISWLDTDPEMFMTPEANRQIRARIQNAIDLEPRSGHDVLELDTVYLRRQFDVVRRNIQKAHNAGVIGIGTDNGGTYTGFFGRISEEVTHYVEFGIPLFDILKYMTSVNATIHGLDDRGIIEPGKLADLIALDGNPLEDSTVLRDVKIVMKGGVFLKYDGIRFLL